MRSFLLAAALLTIAPIAGCYRTSTAPVGPEVGQAGAMPSHGGGGGRAESAGDGDESVDLGDGGGDDGSVDDASFEEESFDTEIELDIDEGDEGDDDDMEE